MSSEKICICTIESTCFFTRALKDGKYLIMDFTCAILAGGKSRRMGRDKATLMVGNKPLINQVYDKAKRIFKEVIILSNHHNGISGIDAPILKDVFPVQGPMVGIVSALILARTPYVFVLACDMPNITEKAIEYMISEAHGEDVIIPKTSSGYEPLHAIYNRSCISYMLRFIEMNRFQITALFPYLFVRELVEHPYFFDKGVSVFTNINAEEDIPVARNLD